MRINSEHERGGPASTPTIYLYDGDNSIQEVDQAGTLLVRYTQSQGTDEPLSQLRAGIVNYYEQDGLSSVTSLTNSADALTNTYSYGSFGKLIASTGTVANPFHFAGREFDQETGIYQNRARYYDQTTGRFLSEDPFGFLGGINKYAYAFDNPANFNDPFGLQGCPEYPTDCVHSASERAEMQRQHDETMARILGPDSDNTPSSAGGGNCECANGGNGPRGLRGPDFVLANINVAIPNPWTGTVVGWSGSASIDRYGNWYWSLLGVGAGKSLSLVSGSLTADWMNQRCKPSPGRLHDMLTTHGISFTGGFWGGVNESYTPGTGWATGVGFVSPQIGGSYNYSFQGPGSTGFNW